MIACEDREPALHGPLAHRLAVQGAQTTRREAGVPLALVRERPQGGGVLEVDTYRLDHPRRRRLGGPGDWEVLGSPSPEGIRPVGLAGALAIAGCAAGGALVECSPSADAWRLAEAATCYAADRRAWLRGLASEPPGAIASRTTPREGEGWIDAIRAIGDSSEIMDAFEDLSSDERASAVLAEIRDNTYGQRCYCAEILGRDLLSRETGPILLDASGLPLDRIMGATWLRAVLRSLRDWLVVVAIPADWPAHSIDVCEWIWARDAP